MPRTRIAAPAQEPDIDALVKAAGGLSLLELVKLSAKLEEMVLQRRLESQRPPSRSLKNTSR